MVFHAEIQQGGDTLKISTEDDTIAAEILAGLTQAVFGKMHPAEPQAGIPLEDQMASGTPHQEPTQQNK